MDMRSRTAATIVTMHEDSGTAKGCGEAQQGA